MLAAANALTCWKLLFHFIFRRILAIHIGRHNLRHKRPDVRDFIFGGILQLLEPNKKFPFIQLYRAADMNQPVVRYPASLPHP